MDAKTLAALGGGKLQEEDVDALLKEIGQKAEAHRFWFMASRRSQESDAPVKDADTSR